MASIGGGVKFKLTRNLFLRTEFRDYLTAFPKKSLRRRPVVKYGSLLHDFVPMVGLAYEVPSRPRVIVPFLLPNPGRGSARCSRPDLFWCTRRLVPDFPLVASRTPSRTSVWQVITFLRALTRFNSKRTQAGFPTRGSP
jgi:hypothetical protein